MGKDEIPSYLRRYTADQDYSLYTYEDQAVWRFIMRQLYDFLKDHAHPAYKEGLSKTGISIEEIPKISEMDKKLQEYGWRAVGVSGFIPPAAFMSLQAHKILPIACEIRTMDHILYTPAPDIVHEAAGHAPILIDPDFTNYLTSYGEVAAKAIISSEDLALYEAIRDLSDAKEHPQSTPDQIKSAEKHLEHVSSNMTYVSEAQFLGRMNWWTAEYGLIGPLDNPKIYGAGLLSSIGEAKNSLKKPKHLPFNIDCLKYTYDITEQQPQLFVVEKFEDLQSTLKEMEADMAFSHGGERGLIKAKQAKSVCTVVLENGKTYSGVLQSYKNEGDLVTELEFQAPCLINNSTLQKDPFKDSFAPQRVVSVYGGPSSFELYPHFTDFVAKKIIKNSPQASESENLLKQIRQARKTKDFSFKALKEEFLETSKDHWLCGLELLEFEMDQDVLTQLNSLKGQSENADTCIDLGLNLLKH
jgi:phenylalanine-4-hydroxylase